MIDGCSWTPRKLDQLGSVGRGRSRHRPRNDPSLYNGCYPFFQTGDIKAANLYLRHYSQTYNETGLAQSRLWEPGTLCITIAANIAETAILGIKGCFPDSVVGFVADPNEADVRFVKYYIDFIKLRMQNVSRGTTQDNLSLDKLLRFDFLVPPVAVQSRIASILSAYDDLIENNLRRIQILEEMAQALYCEWFVEFRFPGHENVEMLQSALGPIPCGWQVVRMEDVCGRITDGAHKSPPAVDDGLPMASVKDMHNWGLSIGECRRIGREDFEELVRNDCKPLAGDVLIAKDGSYLKHVFVVERETDVVLLSSIAILRPNERINPHFLAQYLKEPQVKKRLQGYVSGVAVPRIVLKDFRRFYILLPEQSVMSQWEAIVEEMVRKCWRLVDTNENLRATRDLLLPKLISGELDVSNFEIAAGEAA